MREVLASALAQRQQGVGLGREGRENPLSTRDAVLINKRTWLQRERPGDARIRVDRGERGVTIYKVREVSSHLCVAQCLVEPVLLSARLIRRGSTQNLEQRREDFQSMCPRADDVRANVCDF